MDDAERKAAEAENEEIRKIIRHGARVGRDGTLEAFATLEAADKIVATLNGIGRPLYVPCVHRRKPRPLSQRGADAQGQNLPTPHKS